MRILRAREGQLLVVIISIVLFLSFSSSAFLTASNLKALAMGMTYSLLVGLGMTVVLILGGIDLSVGSNLALTSVVMALLLRNTDISTPIVVVIGLVLATSVGFINGMVVTKFKINPFIVTLGMLSIARGVARVLTSGFFVTRLPNTFLLIGRGDLFGIPIPVIVSVALVVSFDFLLRRWHPLHTAFYVGSHPDNATLFGIHTSRMIIVGFMLSGFFAGLSSLFMTSHLAMGYAQFGTGMELTAIAAAVLGGASMFGGQGSIWGTFLGVLLIALTTNGLALLDVSIYWQKVVIGLILAIAVATSAYQAQAQRT